MRNGNRNNGYIKGYLGGKIIRLDNVWILGMGWKRGRSQDSTTLGDIHWATYWPPHPYLLNSYTWMSLSYLKYTTSKTRPQSKPVPPSVPDTLHYHYLFLQAYLFWPPTFSSKHQPYVMTFMFAMLSFTFESFTCSFCLILCFNSSSNFFLLFIYKFRWHLLQKDFPDSLKCQLAGPNLCADRPLNFSPIGLWLY